MAYRVGTSAVYKAIEKEQDEEKMSEEMEKKNEKPCDAEGGAARIDVKSEKLEKETGEQRENEVKCLRAKSSRRGKAAEYFEIIGSLLFIVGILLLLYFVYKNHPL